MNVIGVACALASSVVSQSWAPVCAECAKALVDGATDEHESAGCRDGAADVRRSGVGESARLQMVELPERHPPDDRRAVDIDGDELAERRRRTGHPGLGIPEASDRPAPRRRALV